MSPRRSCAGSAAARVPDSPGAGCLSPRLRLSCPPPGCLSPPSLQVEARAAEPAGLSPVSERVSLAAADDLVRRCRGAPPYPFLLRHLCSGQFAGQGLAGALTSQDDQLALPVC